MNILKKRDDVQRKLTSLDNIVILTKNLPAAVGTFDPMTNTMGPAPDPPAQNTWKFYGISSTEKATYIDGKVREYSDEFHSGTSISTSTSKFFMSAGYVNDDGSIGWDISPMAGDTITFTDGTTCTVTIVDPLNPTGISLAYDLTVDR